MEKRIENVFRSNGGVANMSYAIKNGISRNAFYSLLDKGEIERLSRGIYRLAALPSISEPDIAVISLRFPKSVVCLISALFFHKITTQIPHYVYVAIPRGARQIRMGYPPAQAFNYSESSYNAGIEEHIIDGIKVKIYSPEKTIADCFKFRNKIGLDVALEALKLYQKRGGSDINKILEYAKICRIENIIKPYMEIFYESY
jgi:predicted transcriptional regulator of viral defense system